ncbi:Glycolipid anchored surface protein GAS1 [Botryosphaeria dothidea]|uniref:1,3-beta-glucanosyltransferase n=1 Tax=Botryosphaeria dothidea TaxID=55169 RepID=A0A8H4IS00_9PEZI|nr:Glycolipid anchored surface protein GAS1 [Botryosphaeria dothidea]
MPVYVAAKHGVVGPVPSYGKFLPEEGITMNAICPNIIRTNIAPNLFFDKVEARGHLTPMSGVLKAFTAMLEPSNISGEIFEIGPNGGYVRRDDPSTWTLKASKESMRSPRRISAVAQKSRYPDLSAKMHASILVTSLLTGFAVSANAIATISVKGAKFFTSDGDQFYVKGVAYQLVPDDPLINATQCKLDADLMEDLGANSIRVYHVDPTEDHKDCMDTFADKGIYLWLDLDTFTTQIEQSSPTWNETQRSAFEKVMDEFQQYDNTAGFFVGNEVLTTGNGSVAAPYVKEAARDLKAYRDQKNYRDIPVGYSAADIASLRPMLQNYLACSSNASENIDFYALNAYEWCGDSSYTTSGYSELQKNASTYNIPIFFSETGCNTVQPRTFGDQSAIFGDKMADTWSGSIIYEWIEEANNYGIVSYGAKVDATASGAPPDGYPRSGTPTPVSPDFSNLKSQWATLTPTGVKKSAYSPSLTAPACPELTEGVWEVNGNVALPTLGQKFDSSVRSSITAGATGASGVAASASASATKSGAASPAKEVKGMGVGLAGVLAGAVYWL